MNSSILRFTQRFKGAKIRKDMYANLRNLIPVVNVVIFLKPLEIHEYLAFLRALSVLARTIYYTQNSEAI